MRRFLRRATLVPILLAAFGLHIRNRPDVDVDVDRPRGDTDSDTDAPGRRRSPLPGNGHASDAAETRTRITQARPKTPGAPNSPRKQLPKGRTRTDADGNPITLDPDRDKPDTDYTSGFTKDLPDPYQDADGNWTINLRMHEGWEQSDFDAKAGHLQDLAADGQLNKMTGDGDDRGSAVDTWRSAKEREIFFDAENQDDLDNRLWELDGQQIDHAHELQLGGRDEHANMWAIDAATNHGMGGQINSQLNGVPDGATNIKINIIPGTYSPS